MSLHREDICSPCGNCEAQPGDVSGDCLVCDMTLNQLYDDIATDADLKHECEQIAIVTGRSPAQVRDALAILFADRTHDEYEHLDDAPAQG